VDAAAELLRLITGYRASQAIYVAARLRLADQLADGPRPVDELATATGSDPAALRRLLRALATVGVLAELSDGRFAGTPLSEHLRSDAESSLVDWAGFVGRPYVWAAWANLEHSVRTGENAFGVTHDTTVWQYRSEHPHEGRTFDAAMAALSRRVAHAILAAYDFTDRSLVCDVGGGTGTMLAALLRSYPGMRGILYDQPHVVADAAAVLATAGVADRCAVVGGDIFDAVPTDADTYLMKSILHDWPDDRAEQIVRTCRDAMKPGAVLLIVERVLTGPPYTPQAAANAFSDLNMLVGPGGQERTEPEYAALLEAGGLTLTRVLPTESEASILEARADP
jgi:SAM-dependent methyltransferase